MKTALWAALKPFNFALWAILIVVLTVAGPFGTYETVTPGWRFVYWASVVLISTILGYQCTYLSRALTRRSHPLIKDLVTTVFMILVFTPVNYLLTHAIVVPVLNSGPTLLEMAGYVASIAFCILTGRRLIPGLEEQNYLPRTHDSNQPRLLRRLPASSRSGVLRITSQGHFVDVVTDCGTNRLRMRLADAVDEMDGVAGFLTHRSHWVAQTAINTVEKDQGRFQLRLSNGDAVPVSRTYKSELEKAGVI